MFVDGLLLSSDFEYFQADMIWSETVISFDYRPKRLKTNRTKAGLSHSVIQRHLSNVVISEP